MKKSFVLVSALLTAALLFAGCVTAAPTPVPTVASTPTVAPTATPAAEPTSAPTEQPTEAAVSPTDTSSLDMSSVLSSMGATDMEAITAWPTGLPAEVPEFTYGSLSPELSFKMDISGITAYAVSYTGVTQDNITAYTSALKDKGFTVSNVDANGTTTYSALYPEKDGSMTMVVMMPIQNVFMVEIMPNVKAS